MKHSFHCFSSSCAFSGHSGRTGYAYPLEAGVLAGTASKFGAWKHKGGHFCCHSSNGYEFLQVEELVQKDVDFIRVQSKVKIEATQGNTIFLQIGFPVAASLMNNDIHGKTAIFLQTTRWRDTLFWPG